MSDARLTNPMSIPAPRRMWSDAEWERLRRATPSDDWTASVVGDRLLLAESGSGNCVYGARFRRDLAGWKIISAEVESDPQTYQPDNPERESERLQSAIERLLG